MHRQPSDLVNLMVVKVMVCLYINSLLLNFYFCMVTLSSAVYWHTGETARINPEVVFDEEDSGKGIIDDAVMDEKKKAVCRIHAP